MRIWDARTWESQDKIVIRAIADAEEAENGKELEVKDLEEVNIVDHYPTYYAMFSFLQAPTNDVQLLHPTSDLYQQYQRQREMEGYRQAYRALMVTLTTGSLENSDSSA